MVRSLYLVAALALCLGAAACSNHSASLLAPGTRIAVRDVQLAEAARITSIGTTEADDVGPKVTDALERFLKARRLDPVRVPPDGETNAGLTVSSVVTKIDGGSLGGRRARIVLWIFFFPAALATMNAGAAHVTVDGEVRRPDGTVVGTFQVTGRGGGNSHEHAMNQASLRIGNRIADMVYTGRYAGAAPNAVLAKARRPAGAPAATTGEDRLRALERLHHDGLISDAEYVQRRQQILDAL